MYSVDKKCRNILLIEKVLQLIVYIVHTVDLNVYYVTGFNVGLSNATYLNV